METNLWVEEEKGYLTRYDHKSRCFVSMRVVTSVLSQGTTHEESIEAVKGAVKLLHKHKK